MYSLQPTIYRDLAAAIAQSLSNIYYFSGSVALIDGDAECRLTASLIIYRHRADIFSDETDYITNVVPVWWDCRTEVDGEAVENDFDFAMFRDAMMSL